MFKYDYLKVGIATPITLLGQPMENAKEMLKLSEDYPDANIIVYPELSLTGSNLGDYFLNRSLLNKQFDALEYLVDNSCDQILVVGGVFEYASRLYNVAYVIQNGLILGIVPKVFLNKDEQRIFSSADSFIDTIIEVELFDEIVPFGQVKFNNSIYNISFGVEIGNDLGQISDAQIVCNPTINHYHFGGNKELIEEVKVFSNKNKTAYLTSSLSVTESASGFLNTGLVVCANCGELLVNECSLEFKSILTLADIDVEYLKFERLNNKIIENIDSYYVEYELLESESYKLSQQVDKEPFVLKSEADAFEIIDVLSNALYHRLMHIGINKVVIGVSGGLDSTLALLIAHRCFVKHNLPTSNIIAFSMPALATGSKSQQIALDLMNGLKVKGSVLPIGEEVKSHFDLINHDETNKNTTYENVQARYRTLVLMNVSNSEKGIVLGTGDMSEIALGWSTFNGDQMSMYNINAGLPKTAIRSLVGYFAKAYPDLAFVLTDVINATITPELTSSSQSTEDIIGKYEINDFIMNQILGRGSSKERVIYLLGESFGLSADDATKYYDNFLRRFKQNQFKRLASPEGVKIFKLSLSPHGDLKFPGDVK